jgi:large subunit ribosomal protein L18
MEKHTKRVRTVRQKRAWRVRSKLRGTAERPRLSVFKSLRHLQVQLIDDETGVTLAGTSTFAKQFKDTEHNSKGKDAAKALGEYIGKVAKEKNIEEVIFDRGRFKYHGVIAALADGARAAGLKF